MADPKGIYFGQGNMGFATILPDQRNPSMAEYVQQDQYRRGALAANQPDNRRKDLESIKNFDTYRYYNPVMSEAYEELVNYVKQPNYDQGEFLIKKNELAQLSQAQMQLKDYDDITFREYDDDKRILDEAKALYVQKYRSNGTLEGLKEAAKSTPNKTFFLNEIGGSDVINRSEAFKVAADTVLPDWMINSVEGRNLMQKRYGNSIFSFETEYQRTKAKAFAKYDEATGQIVAMNADELINAGVLEAFQQDPYTNRIIEDEAIALHKASGVEGPVPDALRAEVLKGYLDPRAKAGEVEKGTKRTTASDFIPASQAQGRETKTTATKWLDSALTGDRNAWDFIKGSQYEGKTVIESEVSPDGTEVTIRLGDPVKEYMEGAQEVFLPTADGSGVETRFVMPSVTRTIDLTDRNRWTDEALLELYRGTVSTSQRPSFGEVRATVKPEKKTRKFDNY